jgi:cytoskeletal protein CcmA (bactofilin family)
MAKQAEHNPNERHNRIVEGTRIEGTLISDSNIRIDGQLSGDIQTKGRLVIGPKGKLTAKLPVKMPK